jgi:hypothetical protein
MKAMVPALRTLNFLNASIQPQHLILYFMLLTVQNKFSEFFSFCITNIVSYHCFSKILGIKLYEIVILPVILYGCRIF